MATLVMKLFWADANGEPLPVDKALLFLNNRLGSAMVQEFRGDMDTEARTIRREDEVIVRTYQFREM